MKNASLDIALNSVVGVLGSGLGALLLTMLGVGGVAAGATAAAEGGKDIGSILAQVASGGVGGGVLLAIVSMVKSTMAK